LKYIGVCYDSGAWGGDLTGLLIKQTPNGPLVVASHISSDVGWSARDIQHHFQTQAQPEDTYEWLGKKAPVEIGVLIT
jgi:hypothetical protein